MNYLNLVLVSLTVTLLSCSKDKESNTNNSNPHFDLVAIKLDLLTGNPESAYGYRNISTANTVDSLPIHIDFQSPGDFGGVDLTWVQGQKLLFSGSIIWMGMGERTFPQNLNSSLLTHSGNAAPMPDSSAFQILGHVPGHTDPSTDLNLIWSGINTLDLVQNRRDDLPMAIYRYTPDVGIGDPANWEYWVFVPQLPLLTPGGN